MYKYYLMTKNNCQELLLKSLNDYYNRNSDSFNNVNNISVTAKTEDINCSVGSIIL